MPKPARDLEPLPQQAASGNHTAALPGGSEHSPCSDGALIASIPGVVWRADARTLRFTFVSGYAATLLGFPVDRWINEPQFWRDHIYPKDRSIITKRIDVLKNTGSFDLEYRMVAADGHAVWVRDLGHVMSDDESRRSAAGVILDLFPQEIGTRRPGQG
jgi:PAS domain-containing protein